MARIEYATLPVPAFFEHTVLIPAGVVTFGVEYRHLDEAVILAFFGEDSREKFGNVRPAGMAEIVEEDGLALHVFATADRSERLRFDCFDDAPHFHFLDPAVPRNLVVEHDPAEGPLAGWAIDRMRTGLSELLREAGASALAETLDDSLVGPALDAVEQAARYVAAAGRPVRVD
jgi:hypothetical protein